MATITRIIKDKEVRIEYSENAGTYTIVAMDYRPNGNATAAWVSLWDNLMNDQKALFENMVMPSLIAQNNNV